MSVFKKRPGDAHYVYDFTIKGQRFAGDTGQTTARAAKTFEDDLRAEIKRNLALGARVVARGMTLDEACGKWFDQVGAHGVRDDQVLTNLTWLIKHFGASTPIYAINDEKVAKMVAKRRGELVANAKVLRDGSVLGERRGLLARAKSPGLPVPAAAKPGKALKPAKTISPSTVNRSATEPLRRVLARARDVWGEPVQTIIWKKHLLKEAQERVRFLSDDEQAAIFYELPEAYKPIVLFALISACRAMECVKLRWTDVNFSDELITIAGKGGKIETIPLSIDLREVLELVRAGSAHTKSEDHVFRQPNGDPMTYRAYYHAFKSAAKRGGVPNIKVHDLRHTAATRIVRETGNLKIAQQLCRHSDLETTGRYAHVLKDDVKNAMNALAAKRRLLREQTVLEQRLEQTQTLLPKN